MPHIPTMHSKHVLVTFVQHWNITRLWLRKHYLHRNDLGNVVGKPFNTLLTERGNRAANK